MNAETVNWLLALGIIGYGIFMVFKSTKLLMKSQKAKKEYYANNKKEKEVVNAYMWWYVLYALVGILGIAGFVYEATTKEDLLTMAAFVFVCLFVITFLLELTSKRSIIFDEDGFFFMDEYYRFRSINGIDEKGNIFRSYEVRLTTAVDKVVLPKRYGELLKVKSDEYRKKRKSKR